MEYRGYKITRKERYVASPKRGLDAEWTEYQVIGKGRRILCREDTLEACKSRIDDFLAQPSK